MKLTREFFRPAGAIVENVPAIPGSEIHRYSTNGNVYAAVFGGKRSKPDWHFRFKNEDHRTAKINEWIENQTARAASAKARRATKNGGHSLKVGDVLNSSWGYDQTNVDFYQVVEVPSKCFVIVQKIAGMSEDNNGPSVRVKPSKDSFIGEPKRYKAGKENTIRVRSFANAYQTDWNESHHETGFGYGH